MKVRRRRNGEAGPHWVGPRRVRAVQLRRSWIVSGGRPGPMSTTVSSSVGEKGIASRGTKIPSLAILLTAEGVPHRLAPSRRCQQLGREALALMARPRRHACRALPAVAAHACLADPMAGFVLDAYPNDGVVAVAVVVDQIEYGRHCLGDSSSPRLRCRGSSRRPGRRWHSGPARQHSGRQR